MSQTDKDQPVSDQADQPKPADAEGQEGLETVTLGAGCFWCVEAVYQQLEGVESVVSGYSGGTVENPTYKDVCTGTTGHAEVVQVTFDPTVVGFNEVLDIFFSVHDPTTLNRQGNDAGTQYRSVVFTHSPDQEKTAKAAMARVQREAVWGNDPVVTQVVPFTKFYPAEDYHQEYFRRNPNQGYCRAVISPKVAKFRKTWAHRLKKAVPAQ